MKVCTWKMVLLGKDLYDEGDVRMTTVRRTNTEARVRCNKSKSLCFTLFEHNLLLSRWEPKRQSSIDDPANTGDERRPRACEEQDNI
jgi:hypothetical protein